MNRIRKRMTDMLDFFRDYNGKSGKYLRVKTDESGIEAVDGTGAASGSIWHSGTGAPATSLGNVTDWYLDDANGNVYEKTGATTWTLRDNLTGPQGIKGDTGANGLDGTGTGSNTVSTSTGTNIIGILKGNGVTVAQATAGTDYEIPGAAATVGGVLLNHANETTTAHGGLVSSTDTRLHAPGSDNQDLSGLIPKSLATAADMTLVSSGSGTWIVKTLSGFKTWLGLGSAAYTASTAYATAAQGTDARPASDVSAWAKAATKPVYNNTEVGADAAGAAAAITLAGLGGITAADAIHPNTAITPGTKTKISYDAKGLITAGADATAADVGAKNIAGFRHVFWPAGAAFPQDTIGPSTGNVIGSNGAGYDTWDFDSSRSTESCQWNGNLEHWNGGTIKVKFLWTCASGSTGNTTTWNASAIALADGATLNASFSTGVGIQDALSTAGFEQISPATASITVSGSPANGNPIIMRVMRTVSDTGLAFDTRLLGIWIEYTEASTEEAAWT